MSLSGFVFHNVHIITNDFVPSLLHRSLRKCVHIICERLEEMSRRLAGAIILQVCLNAESERQTGNVMFVGLSFLPLEPDRGNSRVREQLMPLSFKLYEVLVLPMFYEQELACEVQSLLWLHK